VHDGNAERYPARAGRAIQTTSTLLTVLMRQGLVAGEKRNGGALGLRGGGLPQ
jgi:hypothetical protein